MAENKTKATDASVKDYLAKVANEEQQADLQALIKLLGKVTKAVPKMWGPSIVGFGSYHYKYASGREGDSCLTGFAVRGRDLVVYLVADGAGQDELLAKLGKHKRGKSCLYFRRLSDLDASVLEKLVAGSVAAVKERHGSVQGGASP